MRKIFKKFTQWALAYLIAMIGLFAFILLTGEEDPMHPMSLSRLFLIKGLSMLVIAICVYSVKELKKRGYLPEIDIDEEE